MKPRPQLRAHDSLDQALHQFAQWRRTRRRGTRIPARLWSAAVEAAQEHGVSRVASALRLDYYGLKKRLASASGPPMCEPSGPASANGGGFLEIPLLASAASPECVLEFENGAGTRLRVALKGGSLPDLEPLVRTFWSLGQ